QCAGIVRRQPDHPDETRRSPWLGDTRDLGGAGRRLLPDECPAGLAARACPGATADPRAGADAPLATERRGMGRAAGRHAHVDRTDRPTAPAGPVGLRAGGARRTNGWELIPLLILDFRLQILDC